MSIKHHICPIIIVTRNYKHSTVLTNNSIFLTDLYCKPFR